MQKLQQEIHNKRGILSQIEREIRERGLRLVEGNYPETVRKVNEEKITELDAQKDILTDEIVVLKEQLADPEKEKLTVEQFLNLSKNAAKIVKSGDAVAKDTI